MLDWAYLFFVLQIQIHSIFKAVLQIKGKAKSFQPNAAKSSCRRQLSTKHWTFPPKRPGGARAAGPSGPVPPLRVLRGPRIIRVENEKTALNI